MNGYNEELYRQIAERYADELGSRLLAEQTPALDTGGLERKLRRRISRRRIILVARGAGVLAACLALLVILPQLLRLNEDSLSGAPADAAPFAGEADAAFPDAFDEAEDDYAEDSPLDVQTGGAEFAEGDAGMLPMSFPLPENLSVSRVEQDQAQTIYHLADQWQDDVVLVMEPADSGVIPGGLTELSINGSPAFAASGPDYSLLSFQKDSIVYVLTCRYDINTLVQLGRHIL